MKKNYLLIILMVFVWGVVSSAQAATVTVADNLSDNMLINQGQTVTGQFDINSALAGNPDYNQPYDVTSAVATFKFTDDLSDLSYTGSSFAQSQTAWYHTYDAAHVDVYTSYYVKNTYTYYTDAYEQTQVSIGTQVSSDGTNYYDLAPVLVDSYFTSSQTYTTYTYKYSCGSHGWSTCTGTGYVYYTLNSTFNTYQDVSGYKGDLTIAMSLTPENIEDLSLDGKVDFNVTGQDGDIIFKEGQLTANVEPNPVSSAVPEPATLLLLALGLAGTAGVIRRRIK